MDDQKEFLVDVGLNGLPFPINVPTRSAPDGQSIPAMVTISARIMQRFAPGWIDRFIQVLHRHRDDIGPRTLRANLNDYIEELDASSVKIELAFPLFVEKPTPVSHETCLVRYRCAFSAKGSAVLEPRCVLRIEVPVVTTYPVGDTDDPQSLFGQLSTVVLEVESDDEVSPEELVELVDRHALAPMYSFLTTADQRYLIHRIHTERKTSTAMVGEIKTELTNDPRVSWYSVRCVNFGMLHSYGTVVGLEKGSWVPDTVLEDEYDGQMRLR